MAVANRAQTPTERALLSWGAHVTHAEARAALNKLRDYLNAASPNDVDALRLYMYNMYSHQDDLLGEQVMNDIRETLDEDAVRRNNKKRAA